MVHLLSDQGEQESDAPWGDVLLQLLQTHGKPSPAELVVQLGRDQVQLPHIGLTRVAGDARAVLHRHSHVRVVLHPQRRE
jgi:hypothetical protein